MLNSLFLFLFLHLSGVIVVLPATSSPSHLIVFSTLICSLSSSASLPPLLTSSHMSSYSPPISDLDSLVSSCPAHVTPPLSSVVCHPPSILRVLPTVVCSSPVSLSSSSALLSLPLTPPVFSCLLLLLLLNNLISRAIIGPKPPLPAPAAHSLLPPIALFQIIAPSGSL